MDKIQKILVEAGREDLAQEYYHKVAGTKKANFPIIKDPKKLVEYLHDHIHEGYWEDVIVEMQEKTGIDTTVIRDAFEKMYGENLEDFAVHNA